MYRRRTGRKHKKRTSSASGEVFVIDVLIAEAKASSRRWTKKHHQKFPSNTDESPQEHLASTKVDELLRRYLTDFGLTLYLSLLKILGKITGETQLPGVKRDRDKPLIFMRPYKLFLYYVDHIRAYHQSLIAIHEQEESTK